MGDALGDAPGDALGDAPGDALGDAPGDALGDAPGDALGDALGLEPLVVGDAPGDGDVLTAGVVVVSVPPVPPPASPPPSLLQAPKVVAKLRAKPSPRAKLKNFLFIHSSFTDCGTRDRPRVYPVLYF